MREKIEHVDKLLVAQNARVVIDAYFICQHLNFPAGGLSLNKIAYFLANMENKHQRNPIPAGLYKMRAHDAVTNLGQRGVLIQSGIHNEVYLKPDQEPPVKKYLSVGSASSFFTESRDCTMR